MLTTGDTVWFLPPRITSRPKSTNNTIVPPLPWMILWREGFPWNPIPPVGCREIRSSVSIGLPGSIRVAPNWHSN